MKTIGVLGGIGPQATMDFELRVHRVAQRLIPRRANSAYPPMVVMYMRHPPILFDESGRPLLPHVPEPRMLEAASRLGALADFIVITANGPHQFQEHIERASGRSVLSMRDLVVSEIEKRQCKHVGVVGLGRPEIYIEPLSKSGISVLLIDEALQASIDREVFRVMEGSNDHTSHAVAMEALTELRAGGAEAIILGCTEIPFMLGADAESPDLINPIQFLAEAAVVAAIS